MMKATSIVIEIVTPHRDHARDILKALMPLLVDMVSPVREACLDIHVCPEEEIEEGKVKTG